MIRMLFALAVTFAGVVGASLWLSREGLLPARLPGLGAAPPIERAEPTPPIGRAEPRAELPTQIERAVDLPRDGFEREAAAPAETERVEPPAPERVESQGTEPGEPPETEHVEPPGDFREGTAFARAYVPAEADPLRVPAGPGDAEPLPPVAGGSTGPAQDAWAARIRRMLDVYHRIRGSGR